MDAALAAVKNLAATADESVRRQLITTLHELAYSLEDANDTVHRYGYLHLQTASVMVGFDLGLFKTLAESQTPVAVSDLADKTGADPLFLSRFLSYLASTGAVKETAKNEFAANRVTRNLAEKVTEAGVSHCFETIGRQYQTLPAFLKRTKYRNPSDENHTVFQDAWSTDAHAFSWFSSHPDQLRHFNDYMAFRREPALSWLSVYPVEAEVTSSSSSSSPDDAPTSAFDASRPLYVNIGGGIGHQCAQFKDRFPSLPGRVILQDLPHSIAKALPTPGVENMEHDFFQEQPVKNAKFYFTRGVLHNHPDHKVRTLLERTKAAMAPDSVVLLDEMVLPETGVNSYAAAMDLTMMAALASMERSEAQWRAIIEGVGLRLVKVYTYNPVSYESVMDVRLP